MDRGAWKGSLETVDGVWGLDEGVEPGYRNVEH